MASFLKGLSRQANSANNALQYQQQQTTNGSNMRAVDHYTPPVSQHPVSSPSGRPLYLCQPFVNAALVKGSFKTITALPRYVDSKEWVAVNLVDFFHNLNHFLGVTSEYCTRDACPTMSAGPGMDYTWTSGPTKKQVKVPATEYTDYVLTWAEKTMGDEAIFPTKAGREFPSSFPATARHLYTQFLRIFAHLYHAHYSHILHLSLEGHLNSLFAHFLVFGMTFGLLDPKECKAPREGWPFVVGDLIDAWRSLGILEL